MVVCEYAGGGRKRKDWRAPVQMVAKKAAQMDSWLVARSAAMMAALTDIPWAALWVESTVVWLDSSSVVRWVESWAVLSEAMSADKRAASSVVLKVVSSVVY